MEGVDEADLLKTDGTYTYTIFNKIQSIILAYPSSKAKLASKIHMRDLNPSVIFIEGDYLAIFGTGFNNYSYPCFFNPIFKYGSCQSSNPLTWIKIYDISNRGSPFLIREFKAEGRYLDGRKLDNGSVYLVSTHQFSYRPSPYPWFDLGLGIKDIQFRQIFWYPDIYIRPSAINIMSFNLKNPQSGTKNIVTICI